jgi:D-3-phosphoglycerate dehydrogenase / 2-oxoglutarate reductase
MSGWEPVAGGIVAITDHVFPNLDAERQLLDAAGYELRYDGNSATPEEVRAATTGAVGVLNCYAQMPAEVIRALEGCRVIARYGIGLDTIDLPEATAMGIVVTNVPDYCIDEVSDHALALILALARGIVRLDRAVHRGSWSPSDARPLRRIPGRTLGLVGFGRIARRLAEKAAALGFRVVATDPYVPADAMAGAGVEPRDLDTLLAESDVVSLHAPLSDESRHLIGSPELARMKDGAVLVNTSRGPLVDVEALRVALENGRLGGAGLDVLETEPPAHDDPLLARPDVIVTPHAAFYSEESIAELQRKAAEQVVVALSGGRPPYAVNADELGLPPG